ncbi:MAG: glycosyltransferase family 39 protein [Phycisphaeraceae bacterium]|nr:glycosyltransferase family 39 protein [Phycisphaeraceae bacterium]
MSNKVPVAGWIAPLTAAVLMVATQGFRLGSAPLAGTEGHRAIVADAMAGGSDWMLPRLHGELYLRKPPMHYWILATFQRFVGYGSEGVWRFPSVLAMGALAAWLAWMARRWFGSPADWMAGLSLLTLTPIWSQARSADIDAMNILASVLAATCFLEIGFGPSKRKGTWAVAAALALGATLLLKGHSGLLVIAGAWLGASFLNRSWRWLARPTVWLPLLLGAALAGCWVLAAWWKVQQLHLPPDLRGLGETRSSLLNLHDLGRTVTMPLILTLSALPLSLVLLLRVSLVRKPAGDAVDADLGLDAARADRLRACTGTYLAGLLLCLVNGVGNPRYGYMLLPMLALASGALAAAVSGKTIQASFRRAMPVALLVIALVTAAAVIVTAGLSQHAPREMGTHWPAMLVATSASATVFILCCLAIRAGRLGPAAALVAMLFAVLSCPVAELNSQSRWQRSGYTDAQTIRAIVGPESSLTAGKLIWDKPELLYYTHLPIHGVRHGLTWPLSSPVKGWMVLDRREWQSWKTAHVPHVQHVTELASAVLVHVE